MYNKYYAYQLYKKGFLRVKDESDKSRISKIIHLANEYREKRGYPAKLALENVKHYPIHRKSIQELKNDLSNCVKHKATVEDCISTSGHPEDMKWIEMNARKKIPSRKSLIRNHINMMKHSIPRVTRKVSRKVSRRSSVPYMSEINNVSSKTESS